MPLEANDEHAINTDGASPRRSMTMETSDIIELGDALVETKEIQPGGTADSQVYYF